MSSAHLPSGHTAPADRSQSDMKAIVFHESGGPEVLRYDTVERPRPARGEVLIKVGAATINRGLDVMTREGGFGLPGFSLPHVGGSDAAGEVVELGEGVETFGRGDRVVVYSPLSCGECDFCRSHQGEQHCRNLQIFGVSRWGGHAEYAAVPAQNLVRLPDGVSFAAAAALSVSYLTAWHGLITRAHVGPDDTVLVTAAGSGVGVCAIQACRLRGARVLATTGAEWKQERALELGADRVFDYRDPTWADQVLEATDGRGATVVFDNIGGEGMADSLRCLGRAGRLVCSGATAGHMVSLDLRRLYRDNVAFHFNAQGPKAELQLLVDLVATGELEPVVDTHYPLAEAPAAYERLEQREQFGKVVLVPE